ncbi:hypothetical protein ACF07Q_28520 [Nocardiopsis dassonvillei]|uniref:hypothetical protein n=1 Tax=Nocardiopsis dassonvillei TaxID=2014 RepID=UPI00370066AB
MAKYLVRAELDIPANVERSWRTELGLPEGASLLGPVRDTAWEVLDAGGTDTGRWVDVRVT